MPIKEPIVDALVRKFKSRVIEPAKKLVKDIRDVPFKERYTLGKKIIPQGYSKSREFFDSNSELSRKIQEVLRKK